MTNTIESDATSSAVNAAAIELRPVTGATVDGTIDSGRDLIITYKLAENAHKLSLIL